MGIGSAVQNFYTGLEDGYYRALDRIQDILPVYSIVDPIDKVFPSFLLLSILIVALVALVALNAGTALVPTDHVFVNVVVENRLGEKVPRVPVSLKMGGSPIERQTDSDGFVVFEVPKNSSGRLAITLDGFKPIEENITVTDTNVARR
ncbi:MAG: hypothetical protein Q7R47_02540, partial [Candidatus Diapherotrites archaeon]|nr:hypothetical protein [Candidatus Diapherotrites archaeon]